MIGQQSQQESISWKRSKVALGSDEVHVQTFSYGPPELSFICAKSIDMKTFQEDLEQDQPPFKLTCSIPPTLVVAQERDEKEQSLHWIQFCKMIDTSCSSNLTRLGLSDLTCQKPNPALVAVFLDDVPLPRLQSLELAVNLADASVSRILTALTENFPQLETLFLRNTCSDEVLGLKLCQSLARTLQSLPHLRNILLGGLCLESKDHWSHIQNVLREKILLENVHLNDLTCCQQGEEPKRFTEEASNDPIFLENHACVDFLQMVKGLSVPYTVQQRMGALMHVRACRQINAQKTTISMLPVLSDRLDTTFEFLRNNADPAVWATREE